MNVERLEKLGTIEWVCCDRTDPSCRQLAIRVRRCASFLGYNVCRVQDAGLVEWFRRGRTDSGNERDINREVR